MARLIYVGGAICDGTASAAQEVELQSGKPCSVKTIRKLANGSCKSVNGIQVRYLDDDEPAVQKPTGIPLVTRVRRDWERESQREDGGYPCNSPSRPVLLAWNPYTARYGAQP
jgi:hypothetical protein